MNIGTHDAPTPAYLMSREQRNARIKELRKLPREGFSRAIFVELECLSEKDLGKVWRGNRALMTAHINWVESLTDAQWDQVVSEVA